MLGPQVFAPPVWARNRHSARINSVACCPSSPFSRRLDRPARLVYDYPVALPLHSPQQLPHPPLAEWIGRAPVLNNLHSYYRTRIKTADFPAGVIGQLMPDVDQQNCQAKLLPVGSQTASAARAANAKRAAVANDVRATVSDAGKLSRAQSGRGEWRLGEVERGGGRRM